MRCSLLQGKTAQAVQSDREGVRVSVPGERGAAGEAGHPHREGGQGEPRPRHQAPAPGLPGDGRGASQRQVTVTRVCRHHVTRGAQVHGELRDQGEGVLQQRAAQVPHQQAEVSDHQDHVR